MTDDDDLEKITTPRGVGRSMTTVQPYAQPTVNFSYTGADWFGPLPPLQPIAPPEVAGRTWDFIPGYNLTTRPRSYEPVDFGTLRMLAESYDPLRLIIERRKDQVTRLPWCIRAKHDGVGRRPSSATLSASTRGVIRDVTAFFKKPDYERPFRSWLRELLEDLYVVDAPTLYCERTSSGQLTGLSVIDGATIKPVIDSWGRTPRPIAWDGTPFIWNGESVDLENYQNKGFRIINGLLYPPAWQQVLKGLPAVDYSTWDLLYRPQNKRPGHVYGYSPVEQIMTTVSTAMRRATSQLEYFREGNQPESFYSLPDSWSPDQVQRFQEYWDSVTVGNLGQRRRMKFMAGGKGSYIPVKEPPLKTEFDEWLARICCFAFSYPPTALMALNNRSIAEQHERQGEEEGLEPVKQWVAELINETIERDFSDEVEFAWIEEDDVDQQVQATILQGYVASGIMSVNEARERIGEEPDPSPAANRLTVKTATGVVPIDGTDTQHDDERTTSNAD